jgi:branched-chain amino acid transport system ATP-binding protein
VALLELDRVDTFYGRVQALDKVSMKIDEGEVVTLIGSNGAGKTTTLRTISGLTRAARGKVRLRGQEITQLRPDRIVSLGIGQAPEGRRVFSRMTVRDNLFLGAYVRKDNAAIRQDQEHIFELFPRLKERRDQIAGTLSGGEQQMLAIARALMARPSLLLLDEPSFGLAPLVVKDIFEIMRRIRDEQQVSILLVEQNAQIALDLADTAYLLETGRIVKSGTSTEMRADDAVRRAYLGE